MTLIKHLSDTNVEPKRLSHCPPALPLNACNRGMPKLMDR